jgi:predicted nucleic acid-binding protein
LIFIDSNIPMYLVGEDHPHKVAAQGALERLAGERRRLVTSSEVLQELIDRYVSIGRRDAIEPVFAAVHEIVDVVLPVVAADVLAAKDLVHSHPRLSPRDAVHVAVMRSHQIAEILSFDRGFDGVAGITRLALPPLLV